MEIESTEQVDTVPPRQRMQTENGKNLMTHICHWVVPLPFFNLALSCTVSHPWADTGTHLMREGSSSQKKMTCLFLLAYFLSN